MGARQEDPGPAAWALRRAREEWRKAGLCVNSGKHGPAVPGKGGRCATCAAAREAARHHPIPWRRTS